MYDIEKKNKGVKIKLILNRNDKCYCGSGKKYKNCCMEKDIERERYTRRLTESQKQYAEIYTKICNYSREDKFKESMESAEEIFYMLNTENVRSRFDKFFNTYFINDYISENAMTITQLYFNENKTTENEKRIMQSMINSYVSIYTIEKKEKERVILKDCFLNEEIATDDVNLLKDFEEGDSVIARIVEVSGVNLLIDITVKIVESTGKFMVEDIERLFKQSENDWPNKKIFLAYNTHIFYRYLQQLLDEDVANYVRENILKKAEKVENTNSEELENDNSVLSLINKLADEEYKEKCSTFWKNYEENHKDIKGSEFGWAAAVEYLVKKEEGISVTQAQISKKYEVSPSTIGKRVKELKA